MMEPLRGIAYVPQEHGVFASLTVLEEIGIQAAEAFGRNILGAAILHGRGDRVLLHHAHDVRVHLRAGTGLLSQRSRHEHPLSKLSRGQQERVRPQRCEHGCHDRHGQQRAGATRPPGARVGGWGRHRRAQSSTRTVADRRLLLLLSLLYPPVIDPGRTMLGRWAVGGVLTVVVSVRPVGHEVELLRSRARNDEMLSVGRADSPLGVGG